MKIRLAAYLDVYKRQVYKRAQAITYIGDKECSNMDSALVTTQRCLIYNSLNKELYKKFFLT